MLGIHNAEAMRVLDEKLHLKLPPYYCILEAALFFVGRVS